MVADGVYFSIKAYPDDKKSGTDLSGFIEVADGYKAQLTSSEFLIVSPKKEKIIANLVEFTSRYAERDKNGRVVSVTDRKINATGTLIGDTHRDSGFWGTIHGNYSQRFDYSIFVNGLSESFFRYFHLIY